MKGRDRYVLLTVLLLQICVTGLVFLPTPHNGGDNAGYITLAHSLLDRGTYQELWDPAELPHTKYPPVFSILLAGVMALGVKGWVGLKAVPFLSTLLAGLFTFLWVRRRAGSLMAGGVALLLALSDGVLDYSRWILSDPTFLALSMGALWALERGRGTTVSPGGTGAASEPRAEEEPAGGVGWLALGFSLVILAYFTRSAGLPLVVATVLWLGVGRRGKQLAGFLLAFGLPALLWWIRGKVKGGSEYMAEFWLMDPYRPELGTVGVGGLVARAWENLLDYIGLFIPEGIVGGEGWYLLPLGLGLSILAFLGWARTLRREVGMAELFLPLYGGLMCLWPGVWSGDRFALPLLPLLLFYSASALKWILESLRPGGAGVVMGLAFLLLALPALRNWKEEVQWARECRALVAEEGSWACYGLNVQEYVLLARWSGENLPHGSAVVTRKPRIFFVLSGVKTVSLPLTSDAREFLASAREKGASYLTMDRWDGLASYYLPGVLAQEPGSFCYLTGVETGGQMGIQLLGIRPGGPGGEVEGAEELGTCPGEMASGRPPWDPAPSPWEIPLLVGVGRS
jgi:hypothetical protein